MILFLITFIASQIYFSKSSLLDNISLMKLILISFSSILVAIGLTVALSLTYGVVVTIVTIAASALNQKFRSNFIRKVH